MNLSRRRFIQGTLALAIGSAMPPLVRAALPEDGRTLSFHNIHTGEKLTAVYCENGAYQQDALDAIAHVLKDHRTNEIHAIDPRLLDILATLHGRMDSTQPFEVISGYRSSASNEYLRNHTTGVAINSYHMSGRAIDIRLGDRNAKSVRDTAWAMQQGGVGYYPDSDFVHIDTGEVRAW